MKQLFGTAKSRDVRDVHFRQRGALIALAAACVTVIVASIYGILPWHHPVQRIAPVTHAQTLPAQTANNTKPPAALTTAHAAVPTLATTLKPKRQIAPLPNELARPHNELTSLEDGIDQSTSFTSAKVLPVYAMVEPTPVPPVSTSAPLLVSELPRNHFAYPVVSGPNLVGELQLRALVGADGRVKQVTVLSGNPKLARVGVRAVRQWHYAPYEVLGSPVEVETHIKMSFFGEDAVSVASVATVPPSSSRVASVPSPHD